MSNKPITVNYLPFRIARKTVLLLLVASTQYSFAQGNRHTPASVPAALDMRYTIGLPDAPSSSQASTQNQASVSKTQQQSVPPANETPEQRKADQRIEAEREVKEEEKQRIGSIIPNFNVVLNGQAAPLSARQKFDISFHTIIDPYTFALAALVGGGYGELTDDHTGYSHGPAGFFKRVAANYADNVSSNLIGNALLPAVLHQDPRYFRRGEGSIWSRAFYSAMSTFICRGDNGKTQFNTSNVVGNFLSGAISNAYYPDDERGVILTLNNAIVVTLEGMIGAQLLEFSPDVSSYFHQRREHHRMILGQQADARQGLVPAPVVPKP